MRQILLFLATICLASCTTDALLETEEGRTPLEIKVDIAAYNQDITGVASRSTTNGVVTTLAEGDAIGRKDITYLAPLPLFSSEGEPL